MKEDSVKGRPSKIVTQPALPKSCVNEARDSQVVTQMIILDSRTSALADALQTLENKISPVLRSSSPESSSPEEKLDLVPLAGEICKCNLSLAESLYRVQSMLDRLEL
jgi:hypothetical protein